MDKLIYVSVKDEVDLIETDIYNLCIKLSRLYEKDELPEEVIQIEKN